MNTLLLSIAAKHSNGGMLSTPGRDSLPCIITNLLDPRSLMMKTSLEQREFCRS